MTKISVIEVLDGYKYKFKDDNDNIYELVIELYDMDRFSVGDILNIDSRLLDRNSEYYVVPYAFRKVIKDDKEYLKTHPHDILKCIIKGEKLVLRRLYG